MFAIKQNNSIHFNRFFKIMPLITTTVQFKVIWNVWFLVLFFYLFFLNILARRNLVLSRKSITFYKYFHTCVFQAIGVPGEVIIACSTKFPRELSPCHDVEERIGMVGEMKKFRLSLDASLKRRMQSTWSISSCSIELLNCVLFQ